MSRIKVLYTDRSVPNIKEITEVLDPLGAELIDGKCQKEEDVIALSKDADIIVTEILPIGEDIISASPNVKLVVANSIGYDMIDVSAATRRGIPACNNPDYCVQEVAEHTMALLFSLARKLLFSHKRVCAGHYDYNELAPLYRVKNSVVGLMGFGRIARLTAEKLGPLVDRISFYDPYVVNEPIQGVKKVSMETLLKESDYVCLHMPFTEETRGLINKDTLCMMKPTACIINSARGEVVDTEALIAALNNGELRGAALDVVADIGLLGPQNVLCNMDNVLLTPHSAWFSEDATRQVNADLAAELARFINKEPLQFLLNP